MGQVSCDVTVSADGFVAAPRQSFEHPIGEGGMRIHEWIFDPLPSDAAVIEEWQSSAGAYVMGRNMFGPDRGDWDLSWTGWWGEDPPYHVPVFVLGHRPRASVEMAGGTTFHFVTDGIDSALSRAGEAAGDRDVAIAGGASTINQYLAAGHIEQLHLHMSPMLLGAGERLFDGVPDLALTPVAVTGSPRVTHVKYRVG